MRQRARKYSEAVYGEKSPFYWFGKVVAKMMFRVRNMIIQNKGRTQLIPAN